MQNLLIFFSIFTSCLAAKDYMGTRFTISHTWDGKPLPQIEVVNMSLIEVPGSKDIQFISSSPFYNDPAPSGEPGKPFLGLWDYEVVEIFFLNDKNQYLEVEIGPHGQHIVLLLDGERNTIRHSLPLNFTTIIDGSYWLGNCTIPGDYFPPQVTKINAYAIHGQGEERKYIAMYPAHNTSAPDFHNLAFFKPVNMEEINPLHKKNDNSLSPIWQDALQGIFRYEITRQWNSFRSAIDPSSSTLQGFEGGVEMNFTMPVNEDPFPAESFVSIFENDEGEAFKLQLFVDGNHVTEFFVNREDKINRGSLPIDYRVELQDEDNSVRGSVLIPPSYFPPNVRLMNMYAIFGLQKMLAMTLEPMDALDRETVVPDLGNLDHFVSVDFDLLVESNSNYSEVWNQFLKLPVQKDNEEGESPLPNKGEANAPVETEKVDSEVPLGNIPRSKPLDESTAQPEENGRPEEGIKEEIETKTKDTEDGRPEQGTKEETETKTEDTAQVGPEKQSNDSPVEVKYGNRNFNRKRKIPKAPETLKSPRRENLRGRTQQKAEDNPEITNESKNEDQEPVDRITERPSEEGGQDQGNELPVAEEKEDGLLSSDGEERIQAEGTTESVALLDVPEDTTVSFENDGSTQDGGQNEPTEAVTVGALKPSKVQRNEDPSFDFPLRFLLKEKSGDTGKEEQIQSVPELEEVSTTPPEENQIRQEVKENVNLEDDQSTLTTEGNDSNTVTEVDGTPTPTPDIEEPDSNVDGNEVTTNESVNKEARAKDETATQEPESKNSLREDYQRRYEERESDQNELPITFKLTFKSSVGTQDGKSTTAEENPKISTEEEEKLEQDIDGFLPPLDPLPLDAVDEDEISSILDLLPPPHPICFIEGLVPDFYRCQVFYECVIADGQWEVYSWRCKRGYYYDAEKVACIKGYC